MFNLKYFLTAVVLLATLTVQFAGAAPASAVRIKISNPNDAQPRVPVQANTADKRVYTASQSVNATWVVGIRGYCQEGSGISQARLMGPDGSVLVLDSGSGNHALTGNGGQDWQDRVVRGTVNANNPAIIQACNQRAQQMIQQNPSDQAQILNSGFETGANSGLQARITLRCTGQGAGFQDSLTVDRSVRLPVDALCTATGFQQVSAADQIPALVVKAITEIQETQDSAPQSCRLKASVGFTATQPNTTIRYRFHHGRYSPQTRGYKYDTGPIKTVVAGSPPTAVVIDYIDVPAVDGPEKGKLRVKVVSPNAMNGPWVNYEMDCSKPINTLHTSLPPTLTLGFTVAKREMVGGQYCPSEIIVSGNVRGRGDYSGNVLFVGDQYLSSLLPYTVTQGQTVRVSTRRNITWISQVGSTLQIAGGNNTPAVLRQKTIRLGMRVTNSNNEVFASLPQKTHTLKCSLPDPRPVALSGIGLSNGTPTSTPSLTAAIPHSIPAVQPGKISALAKKGRVLVQALKLSPAKQDPSQCTQSATYTLYNQTTIPRVVNLVITANGRNVGKNQVIRLKPMQKKRVKSTIALTPGRNTVEIKPRVKGFSAHQLVSAKQTVSSTCGRRN